MCSADPITCSDVGGVAAAKGGLRCQAQYLASFRARASATSEASREQELLMKLEETDRHSRGGNNQHRPHCCGWFFSHVQNHSGNRLARSPQQVGMRVMYRSHMPTVLIRCASSLPPMTRVRPGLGLPGSIESHPGELHQPTCSNRRRTMCRGPHLGDSTSADSGPCSRSLNCDIDTGPSERCTPSRSSGARPRRTSPSTNAT